MLNRNENIRTDICEVQIRSSDDRLSDLLSKFECIYSTPSASKFTYDSKKTPGGIIYSSKITLKYPGLKSSDFLNFNKLLNLTYLVRLQFTNKQIFQVGEISIPMEMRVRFKTGSGTQITFTNKSFYPAKYIGELNEPEIVGFPYVLKINL